MLHQALRVGDPGTKGAQPVWGGALYLSRLYPIYTMFQGGPDLETPALLCPLLCGVGCHCPSGLGPPSEEQEERAL